MENTQEKSQTIYKMDQSPEGVHIYLMSRRHKPIVVKTKPKGKIVPKKKKTRLWHGNTYIL